MGLLFARLSSKQLTDSTASKRGCVVAQGDEVFFGLNKNGVVLFIILLLLCFPLAWIPFLIDSMKAANRKP
jgi:hypothetical protein